MMLVLCSMVMGWGKICIFMIIWLKMEPRLSVWSSIWSNFRKVLIISRHINLLHIVDKCSSNIKLWSISKRSNRVYNVSNMNNRNKRNNKKSNLPQRLVTSNQDSSKCRSYKIINNLIKHSKEYFKKRKTIIIMMRIMNNSNLRKKIK